jgi:hypothetical protein
MAQYKLNAPHGTAYRGVWNTAIIDMAEAAQWATDLATKQEKGYSLDGMNVGDVANALRNGDTSLVAESDRYMEAFADMTFNACKEHTIAAVSGGAVNVGAHLSGTPLSMRRRERLISPMGPLTVFIDGSGSGNNTTSDLSKRGAALLGLIRMLAAVRPVNLYMACGGSFATPGGFNSHWGSNLCASVFTRINTAQLDLSRDGFAIAHPAFCRSFVFKACKDIPTRMRGATLQRDDGTLGWELGGIESYRKNGLTAFCTAIGCDQEESVFFTPMYGTEVLGDPVKWIKDMMVRYGGQSAYAMES